MDQILLRLSPQDVTVILNALTKQPLGDVFDTYVRLRQALQIAAQPPAQPQQGEQIADTTKVTQKE